MMKSFVQEMLKRLSLVGVAALLFAITVFGVVSQVRGQDTPVYTSQHQVRMLGQSAADWKSTQATKAGDTLEWTVKFKNLEDGQLDGIVINDQLDAGLSIVPESVKLYNSNFTGGYHPTGSDLQINGRQVKVNIGSYTSLPQADRDQGYYSAQVVFATKVEAPAPDKCGQVTLTSKADLTPENKPTISQTAQAVVDTGKACEQPQNPQPQPTSDQATYACKNVTLTKLDNPHTIKVDVKAATAGGALIKRYTYDFGDGKTPLVTDRDQVDSYVYEKDGTYAVTVRPEYTVDGQTKTNDADKKACVATITFTAQTPAVQAATTDNSKGGQGEIPNTGPGTTVATVFAVTSVVAAAAHYLLVRRQGV